MDNNHLAAAELYYTNPGELVCSAFFWVKILYLEEDDPFKEYQA